MAFDWFRMVATVEGSATCPITENGLVRAVSQVGYPNLRLTPAMAADSRARFQAGFSGIHRFWADDMSLNDAALFDLGGLTGSRQVTDAYLAGLAFPA